MWAMNSKDRAELEAYRALGTPEQIKARLEGPYPDDDGLAPMPYADHDPAQAATDAHEDAWDYPDDHHSRRFSGLTEDES